MNTNPPNKTQIAQRHPQHYLMHKYWARKPHNVVGDYIEHFTNKNDVVLDPFSGSGVTIIESIKRGRKAISVDINPISNHIIEGTSLQVSELDFEAQINEIKKNVKPILESYYKIKCQNCSSNATINHTVWSQEISCKSCKTNFLVIEAKKKGRSYICSKCKELNRPYHKVIRKEIPYEIKYHCSNCKKSSTRKLNPSEITNILKKEKNLTNFSIKGELIQNPRTLIEKNMKASDLFTSSNLNVLKAIHDSINKIKNSNLKQIMLFVFTSSLAQSSRLIAYRGGLATGGPAWTVSGFWIPPINLEINPLNNFLTKARKILQGKKELSKTPGIIGLENFKKAKSFQDFLNNKNILIFPESIISIKEKKVPTNSVDYIFTDPPYGDSVPYLEYCAFWTAWLRKKIDYKNEIIISNSPERNKNSEDYHSQLIRAFSTCFRMLKPGHWMSLTFHNRSFDTWDILLDSIRKAGFEYQSTEYLVPAVIPAKAQLSKEGSLEGDLIMHFKKPGSKKTPQISSITRKNIEKKIIKRVEDVLSMMGGKATTSQILNSILFLLLDLDHIRISYYDLKSILLTKFILNNGYWEFKSKPTKNIETFRENFKKILKEKTNSNMSEQELIAKIYNEFKVWQVPPISHVRKQIQELKK